MDDGMAPKMRNLSYLTHVTQLRMNTDDGRWTMDDGIASIMRNVGS